MKTWFLLIAAIVLISPRIAALGADKDRGGAPPVKLSAGCNEALLEGEFALSKAPEMPASDEQKEFIETVIGQMKEGYGGTMVTEDSPHPLMDTPEFVALFLREFADPGKSFDTYDYRCERLMARLSGHISALEDARLDWDMWRAWLLLENTAHTSSYYESETEIGGSKVMNGLDSAREILWNYLNHNAPAILKDEKRRGWWISQLTRDLEAPGGRPQRRWFLLALVRSADPKREALEKIPMKDKSVSDGRGGKTPLRQPHPLDPFLILENEKGTAPRFADALTRMAADSNLSLEVLGLEPAGQPPTTVHSARLEITKWPVLETPVINQESWSKPDKEDQFSGYEWGVRFYRPVGRRANFSSVTFPEDRRDGVYFFVFNQRLYVWAKERMDAAVIQMLHTAKLIDDPSLAEYRKRGFPPLKTTLVKERKAK